MRKVLKLIVGCVIMGAIIAQADEFSWYAPGGGSYGNAANWTPAGGPPGAGDVAILEEAPSGAITLYDNTTNHTLRAATDGGPLVLDLNGNLLELLNYTRSSTYGNWGVVVREGADLVVTSSVSGGFLKGLDLTVSESAADNSVSVYVEGGASLEINGANTKVELHNARTAPGGQIRLLNGASVRLGQDKARANNYFIGNGHDDVSLIVDGTRLNQYETKLYIQDSTVVVTNGGYYYNYRGAQIGANGKSGRLAISGSGSRFYLESGNTAVGVAGGSGYIEVRDKGVLNTALSIANANNSAGEVVLSGSGTTTGGRCLRRSAAATTVMPAVCWWSPTARFLSLDISTWVLEVG